MIAHAPAPTDPRAAAKARLRVVSGAAPDPRATPRVKESKPNSLASSALGFVSRHPAATAATVVAAAAIIGPMRLVRFGLSTARVVMLASSVAGLAVARDD
ncbi:MAG: hypothetical protein R3B68_16685 [Phycisphaerales bacterium]